MPLISLSLGKDTMTALELEPSSAYHVTCPKSFYINVDVTAHCEADEDNYVHWRAGSQNDLVTRSDQFQMGAIAGDDDSPETALPLDDPGAQILTLEKYTPPPPIE